MGAGLRDIGPKEVLSAVINGASGTGDVEVVAANAKKIVVVNFFFTVVTASRSCTVQSYNASTQTDLTGPMTVSTNGWIKGNYNPDGHFGTVPGDSLVIERTGGSNTIGGWLNYYLE